MLMTLQEHVKNCNYADIIRRMISTESTETSLIREYIDTLFAISEVKSKPCIPGNEIIIVDMKFPKNKEKLPLFYVLHATVKKVLTLRFNELKLKEMARLYVSDYVIKTFGIEVVISEALYSYCKKKEKVILDKTNLMKEMEREDLKYRECVNDALHILHVYDSRNRADRRDMIEELRRNFGHTYTWAEIMEREEKLTERLCTSLLPYNPPSLAKLQAYSKREIKRRAPFGLSRKTNKNYSIIIEPYRISDQVPPFIYVHGKNGRKTLWDYNIVELLSMPIIVKEKKLYYRRDLICGYLLLYLAYPRRMQRESKRDAIALFANVIAQKADL